MSRNGAGVYSLPAGSTVANGDVSDAADLNTPLADLEADMNIPRPVVAGGTGASTAADARTNLGLVIGTNVQAYDAALGSLAGLSWVADRYAYSTGVDTFALGTITTAGRNLLDDADAAAQRTTLGLGALATAASVTTAEIAAATLVTASETIASNNNDTTLPTSSAVKGYVDSKAIGIGQTWQNVAGSRTGGTSYQNTTGRPIQISMRVSEVSGPRLVQVSADNSTFIDVGAFQSAPESYQFIVPDTWYYRTNGSCTISVWAELR